MRARQNLPESEARGATRCSRVDREHTCLDRGCARSRAHLPAVPAAASHSVAARRGGPSRCADTRKKSGRFPRPPFLRAFEALEISWRCSPGGVLLRHLHLHAPIPPRNLDLEHPGEESFVSGGFPPETNTARHSENQRCCRAEASSLLTSPLPGSRARGASECLETFVSTEVRDPEITSRALCYRSPRGPASGVPGPGAFAPSCPTSSEHQTWIHAGCSFGATSEYQEWRSLQSLATLPIQMFAATIGLAVIGLLRAHSPPGDCLVALCTFLILLIQILMASTNRLSARG